MITRTRRPQGFQVQKRRSPRPLDYFAANGTRFKLSDPEKEEAEKDADTYMNNLLNAPLEPLAGEQNDPPESEGGFMSYIKSLGGEAYDSVMNYISGGEEEQAATRLSFPQRDKGPSDGSFDPVYNRTEGPFDVADTTGNAPPEFAGDSSAPVKAIKEPNNQPQTQAQPTSGGGTPTTSAERKFIQRYYESSNNPKADSGYAGGLYGIAEGALTDAIKDGIVPEGSDVYDEAVNEKVRDYYIDKMYNKSWVKNAESDISRLARAYSGYNQGSRKAVEGWNAAKKAGFDINPTNSEELVALMDAKGEGKYDGYFWPKETRDYVKGIVAGQFDPSRLPKDFKLGQQMDEGGRLEEGDPIDPKKMAMYNDAFKKTMGGNYENVPPEMISNITNLVAGGDLLSKTDQINAQLVELRKLGLDTNLLFENLAEAEGGGFGAKMKYGAAARMFSE